MYLLALFSSALQMQANKRVMPGTVASQVRSLRKTNNDQVAVAIDVDPESGKLEDEDDDKGNDFYC